MTAQAPATPKLGTEVQWTKCPSCDAFVYHKRLKRNLGVCPECNYHFRLPIRERLAQLLDEGSFVDLSTEIQPLDPLGFADSKPYPQRLEEAQRKAGSSEGALYGTATMGGRPLVLAAMDFAFIGGSMGSVVGEKITRIAERALAERRPLVIVSASGGARMQEGTLALMQMAKIVGALGRLADAGVPFVSILTDPTTGGVLASYASLGDLILAEPDALIGFSGARVTDQTIGEKLPKGFQRSEFVLAHGFIDQIVPRPLLRERLTFFLDAFRPAAHDMKWSL